MAIRYDDSTINIVVVIIIIIVIIILRLFYFPVLCHRVSYYDEIS